MKLYADSTGLIQGSTNLALASAGRAERVGALYHGIFTVSRVGDDTVYYLIYDAAKRAAFGVRRFTAVCGLDWSDPGQY